MAWTAITSGMTDADSPLDQTLMDRIRTNDQDHEDRIGAFLTLNDSSVNDDFTASAINGKLATGNSGSNTNAFDAVEHLWKSTSGASSIGHGAIEQVVTSFQVRFTRDHKVVLQVRYMQDSLDIANSNIVIGFQDVANVVGGGTVVSDVGNFVGWKEGSTNDTLAFVADDTTGPQTGSDFGDVTAWTIVRVEVDVTSAGTVFSARGFLDGVLKTTHTTDIPIVDVRPVFGSQRFTGSGGEVTAFIDYFQCFFAERSVTP